MKLGEKLIKLRTRSKLSQEQLAKTLGVTRQLISKWEIDISTPQVDKILQICKIFNLSADELIDDSVEVKQLKDRKEIELVDKTKYFSTEGFSGEANVKFSSDQAYKVGRFLGWYYSQPEFNPNIFGRSSCQILIGKDTRRSSYMFEYAIAAGITASGGDAYILHVTTKACVSWLTRVDNFDCGIMITASDNIFSENGIILMQGNGESIDLKTILMIEAYLDNNLEFLGSFENDIPFATKDKIGSINDYVGGRNRYIGQLIAIPKHNFRGLNIGLDTANGSSWMIAANVFNVLGANTFVIGNKPNGFNTNEKCGPSNIESLVELVKEKKLDMGFAFDSDADRCIAVDEKGNVLNGDKILYIFTTHLAKTSSLLNKTLVVSNLSNLGLDKSLSKEGIRVVRTEPGERNIYEKIVEEDCGLGGEESGSLILRKFGTVSDGILTALLLVDFAVEEKASLSKLASSVRLFPRINKEIKVKDVDSVLNNRTIVKTIETFNEDNSVRFKLIRSFEDNTSLKISIEASTNDICNTLLSDFTSLLRKYYYLKD